MQVGSHIFISHASGDRDGAAALADALERRGLKAWIAPRDIQPGRDYSEQLDQALAAGAAVVVVISHASGSSASAREEAEQAASLGKPVYPVRIADASCDFAPVAAAKYWADAFGPNAERNIGRLAEELQTTVGRVAGARPAPAGAEPEPTAPAVAPAISPPPPEPAPVPPAPTASPVAPPAPNAPPPPLWTPEPGNAPPAAAAVPASAGPEGDAMRAAFVGPNADYYIAKWNEMAASGTGISWNWAAFLLSLFWLTYRKMFVAAGVTAAGFLLFMLLGALVPSLALVTGGVTLGLAALVGIFGNRVYRDHVDRSLAGLERSSPDPESLQEALRARGGVAMPLALGAAALWVAIAVGLYFLVFRGTQPSYPEFGTEPGGYATESSGSPSIAGDWIVGKWALAGGPTCGGSWIRFNADRTFTDNDNSYGTWSLTSGYGRDTLTLSMGSMPPRSGSVVHSGDTMTMGFGARAVRWRRATC